MNGFASIYRLLEKERVVKCRNMGLPNPASEGRDPSLEGRVTGRAFEEAE